MIAKAVVLALGGLVYLGFVQYGRDAANQELARIQYFYTAASAQTAAISTENHPALPGDSQPATQPLSKKAQ